MISKMIFEQKIKAVYLSEMARYTIESDFRPYKMAAGGHFVKKNQKKSCVLIWNGEICEFCETYCQKKKWFSIIHDVTHSVLSVV